MVARIANLNHALTGRGILTSRDAVRNLLSVRSAVTALSTGLNMIKDYNKAHKMESCNSIVIRLL